MNRFPMDDDEDQDELVRHVERKQKKERDDYRKYRDSEPEKPTYGKYHPTGGEVL